MILFQKDQDIFLSCNLVKFFYLYLMGLYMECIFFSRFKATIMQARRLNFIRAYLDDVFKKKQKRPSITLRILTASRNQKKNLNSYEMMDDKLSSLLCTNKYLARLGSPLWTRDNVKLYTIYPQQKVNLSNWLTCPEYGNSFPLYIDNCCQILSKSDLHILVEVDTETYGSKASTSSAKLEDYGSVTAWTVLDNNMSFILKTDLEHITCFMSGILQGQYWINNGLFVTRVQSVLVSGNPFIYNDIEYGPPPDKDNFYALCDAAQAKISQLNPKEVAKIGSRSVKSQDKNLNIEFTEDEEKDEVENDIGTKSKSAPATCSASPTNVGLVTKPHNLNLPSHVHVAVTQDKSEDYTNLHLPDVTEKKDNTDDEESKNINQSKSTRETNSKLKGEETPSKVIKPPNVIICADTTCATNYLQNLLLTVLEKDRYDVHTFLKTECNRCEVWIDDVSLVVVCGDVGAELGAQLIEYIICGGKLLALCSDMLHILLPSFKTAEVRENELVHFSYGKWKRVRMMHHIFCYHASPIRTRFSQDHEVEKGEDTRPSALSPPTSTSIKDKKGKSHSFDVKVLGREETWHSPSILLATLPSSGGKVVFSQIHLEIDPREYVDKEDEFDVLNNFARLEIITDLLSTHLGLNVNRDREQTSILEYTPSYFLGKFEMKMKMLEQLKDKINNNVLQMSEMQIQFYGNNEDVHSPSAKYLPLMMHMCPPNFSTVDYFENLHTKELGRLVIYSDILTSTMNAINTRLKHGLAVITRQQTKGRGRYSNHWLSPKGCVMFTLQIHITVISDISRYISILQHVAAVALVSAVRSIKGYEDIDLRIKWPNDIYIGNSIKIGGIIVSSLVEDAGALFVCNIGAGINLSNSKPTTCINDVILQYNQKYGTKLKTFSYEKYLALVFNEMEILLDILHHGNTDYFYQLYYKYWLHTSSNVTVTFIDGRKENVTVIGIDNYGYLLVQGKKGMFSVHSDENSFDVLKGLIVPKWHK